MPVKSVTVIECAQKRTLLRGAIGLLYVFSAVIVVIVGWALLAASSARTEASDVHTQLEVHAGRQEEAEKSISKSLLRIEIQIEKNRNDICEEIKDQRIIFEQMIKTHYSGTETSNLGSALNPNG